jgi:putative transposase
MDRGIEKAKVFRSDADRDRFLERLGEILQKTKTLCYAWALIPSSVQVLTFDKQK